MFRNVFLIDITEHRGLEQNVINSVQAYASEINPELIDWFKLSRQVSPEVGIRGKVFSGLETGLRLWPQISQRISELSSNGYGGSIFHVLSYDPYVLAEARKLNRSDLTVRTSPLAVLLTRSRAASRAAASYGSISNSYQTARRQFNPVAPLPVQEALELTKQVLRQHGHISKQTALLKVQLRPLLVRLDPRAKKNPLDRNSSRLVANIVVAGVEAGSIGQYDVENIPGTERIWLIETESAGDQAASQLAQVARNDGVAQIRDQTAPAAATSEQPPVQKSDECSNRGRLRTDLIIKALKRAGVYSPKPQRDELFKAVRSCLPAGAKAKTVVQLSREIRQQASSSAGSGSEEFPYWHPATEGMVGMLLGAGVLRNEAGDRVTNGLFARGSKIVSFEEPLEDLCEAFLLETAIAELKDITKRDRIPIAHALFWNGALGDRDQVEDKFEHVFSLLEDRLAENAEGIWYVKGKPV